MEAEERTHPNCESEIGEKSPGLWWEKPSPGPGEVLGNGVGHLPLTLCHAPDGRVQKT